jgi:hypothetical protein
MEEAWTGPPRIHLYKKWSYLKHMHKSLTFCLLPSSWKVRWKSGSGWKQVESQAGLSWEMKFAQRRYSLWFSTIRYPLFTKLWSMPTWEIDRMLPGYRDASHQMVSFPLRLTNQTHSLCLLIPLVCGSQRPSGRPALVLPPTPHCSRHSVPLGFFLFLFLFLTFSATLVRDLLNLF